MMRGQTHFAVACRRPDGSIVLREEPVPVFFTRYRWAKWPFFRGVFALADALVLGIKSLMFSASLAVQDLPVSERAKAEKELGLAEGEPVVNKQVSAIAVPASAVGGLLMGLGLFVLLPTVIAGGVDRWLHPSDLALNLTEGVIRIGLV